VNLKPFGFCGDCSSRVRCPEYSGSAFANTGPERRRDPQRPYIFLLKLGAAIAIWNHSFVLASGSGDVFDADVGLAAQKRAFLEQN
jgi:hypothetical protein